MLFDPLWALLLVLILFNAYASYLVFLDETPATPQFWMQMGVVWLLPMLGAALIVFVKGMQDAKPSVRREGLGDESGYPGQEGSVSGHGGGGAGGGGD